MMFTELELAIEEADFLCTHDLIKYYLVHDGENYHLLTDEERTSNQFANCALLEVFRPLTTPI